MDEGKKSKTAKPETAATPTNTPPAPEQQPAKEPVFSLERLRRDCFKVFGVTTSTFDGATYGLKGEFTVKELRDKIHAWQNKQVFPASKKGGN